MKVHELKTWRGPFRAVKEGVKRYEIRKSDRDFCVGDTLRLREWNEEHHVYTGDEHFVTVTYITRGGDWGLPDGLCVMSIEPTNQHPRLAVGTIVQTAAVSRPSTDWSKGSREHCLWGVRGVIDSVHDAHGLHYCVRHYENGTKAYYEPRELIVVESRTLNPRQAEAFARLLLLFASSSLAARWDQLLRHDVGDDDTQAIEEWLLWQGVNVDAEAQVRRSEEVEHRKKLDEGSSRDAPNEQPTIDARKTAFDLVFAERMKQIRKGYGEAHDDKYVYHELEEAACHVIGSTKDWRLKSKPPTFEASKHGLRHRYIVAAALLLAEIERLLRAEDYQRKDAERRRKIARSPEARKRVLDAWRNFVEARTRNILMNTTSDSLAEANRCKTDLIYVLNDVGGLPALMGEPDPEDSVPDNPDPRRSKTLSGK